MAEAVITLRILRRGPRAELLLEQLGNTIADEPLSADDHGTVLVRAPRRAQQTWDQVRDALDAAGSDWRQWLYLSPRPSR
jgi:hypothetical protein